MYKVLIADNDKLESAKISQIFKQNDVKCDIVTVDNGEEALEYLNNNYVDILFTDVEVSQTNGMEWIARVSELNKDIKTVVISRNYDYKFARQAIKLGVSDYILKPIDKDDLLSSFVMIVKDLEKNKTRSLIHAKSKEYIMEHILHLATNGSNLKEIYEYSDGNVSIDFLSEYHCMIMLDFNNDFFGNKGSDFKEKFVGDNEEYTYLNLNSHQSLFLFKDKDADYIKRAEGLVGKVFVKYGEKCFAAVSQVFDGYDNLSKAMEELEMLMENKFYYRPGEVFYSGMNIDNSDAITIDDDTIMKQMKQSLKMKDTKGLRVHFESFCNKYRNKTNFSQVYIKFLFANLLKDFNAVMAENDENVLNEEIEKLYKSGDFGTVIKVVNNNIDRLEEVFLKNPQMIHREIEVVKEYIFEHYGEEISVDKLADLVYMAPSYLSSIFKKETGQNLSKFIKGYRMERAKDMLENTMSKIVDISMLCGYPNVSYFCSSFREYYGVSPQKYRESGEDTNTNE